MTITRSLSRPIALMALMILLDVPGPLQVTSAEASQRCTRNEFVNIDANGHPIPGAGECSTSCLPPMKQLGTYCQHPALVPGKPFLPGNLSADEPCRQGQGTILKKTTGGGKNIGTSISSTEQLKPCK